MSQETRARLRHQTRVVVQRRLPQNAARHLDAVLEEREEHTGEPSVPPTWEAACCVEERAQVFVVRREAAAPPSSSVWSPTIAEMCTPAPGFSGRIIERVD
jgi:hypothetical protein